MASLRRLVFLCATLVVAGAYVGAASAQPALDLLNERFRRPLGIPDAVWDPLIARAAQNHADYWAAGGAFGHEEEPGRAGFTGVEPWDRCNAVGVPGCGEVAFQITDLVAATSGWMETPYHGLGLLSAATIGCGSGTAGSACDLGADVQLNGSNRSAAANAADSPVRIWPYDGAADVPVAWWGGEIPDPLENYTGDGRDVGTVFFLWVDAASADITLSDPTGKPVPLLLPEQTSASTQLHVIRDGDGWQTPLAARTLKSSTRYELKVVTDDGVSRSVHFTTAADPKSSCAVRKLPLRNWDGTLTVQFDFGECDGYELQVLAGTRWQAKPDDPFVVLTPGHSRRWRVIHGDDLVASGTISNPKRRKHS